ncbi:MAG: flagellar type III secretion system pore protein FliP [Limnochordia bacterium]|jgi:flagellar biosynthetic protein FliP
MKTRQIIVISLLAILLCSQVSFAQPVPLPRVEIGVGMATEPEEVAQSLQILALLTILTLAPAILMLMTSFTRIVIVLGFVRNALATQQTPPNQVLIGLALFLTFFIMAPTWQVINEQALQPYFAGQLAQPEALARVDSAVRNFMLTYTREKDLELFVSVRGERPASVDDIPTVQLIPAFVISELKTAFQMAFILFIPFIVIDMIVASALMSMGMLMLPPVMISLPFKILLFVLVDGWHLITRSLLLSFQ